MSEIAFGGRRFKVQDVSMDTHPDDEMVSFAFGEVTIGDLSVTSEGWTVDPELAKVLFGQPPNPRATVEVTVPGKRYWWKPWRRRPTTLFHFRAVIGEGQ